MNQPNPPDFDVNTQTIELIEEMRSQLHRFIDARFDLLLQCCQGEENAGSEKQTVFPLQGSKAFFKGRKPAAVVLGQREVEVKTWRTAVQTVLRDCASAPERLEKLMSMRGRVNGIFRVLLTERAEQLNAPIEVCDALYFEGKFDTEALLRVLEERILSRVGYDAELVGFKLRSQ